MDLFQSVKDPDRTGWDKGSSIGEWLGLPQSAIDEIKSSYQSAAQRKEAYLDTYANQHPWPSWRTVVDVLWQCRLDQQCGDVNSTFVQGEQVNDCSLINKCMTLLEHNLVKLRHTCTCTSYIHVHV